MADICTMIYIRTMVDTNRMLNINAMAFIIMVHLNLANIKLASTIMAYITNGQYHHGQCLIATVAQGRAPVWEIWVQDPSVAQ